MHQQREDKDFHRAFQAQKERHFDVAVALWEAYVERHADRASAHGNLALCLINTSRPSDALVAARRAYGLSRVQFSHLILLQALLANGLVDELERRATQYVERYPNENIGMGIWGEAAYISGDLQAAENRLLKSLEIEPRSGGYWAMLGKVYMDWESHEKALEAWGRAQAHADARPMPRDQAKFEALMGMGWSLLLLERPDRALVLAEQAEKLNVNPAEAQGLRARCLLAMGRPDGLRVAEDAMRNGHRSDHLRARVALAYALLGKRDEAEKHLNRVGEAPDNPIVARSLLAGTLSILGRTDEAIIELDKLEGKLEPHVRFNGLAIAYRLADDYDLAEEMSLKALEIRRDEVILATLASQYIDRERYDEAQPLLEEAVRLAPNHPEVRWMLAYCYALNHKQSRAREHLKWLGASEYASQAHRTNAADLLGRIDRDEQISAFYTEQGLVLYPYESLQQTVQRSRQQDTLRYEEECARLAARRDGVGWTEVGNDKKVTHSGSKRQIDVFGLKKADGRELLCVGECKMKTGSKVNYREVKELVEKMALVLCQERHGGKRGVEGCFFSASGYDEDALELAHRHGIRAFFAVPRKGWQKRADWKLGTFKEISSSFMLVGGWLGAKANVYTRSRRR